MKKRFLSGLLAVLMAAALLPALPAQAASDQITARINAVLKDYPNRSYFTRNGSACTIHGTGGYCDNCRLSNIVAANKISGWKKDADAYTCVAFTRYVFQRIFEIPMYQNGKLDSKHLNMERIAAGTPGFEKIFQYTKPGDVLYC